MLRAVAQAAPEAEPAFAHVRLRAADGAFRWCECKLTSDVRTPHGLLLCHLA